MYQENLSVLLAYELLHTFEWKRGGKNGLMALKVDMNKVYDKVEWIFLRAIRLKMRFGKA